MYLIEINLISQSIVSDIQPYKSASGSNRTEGTFEEALANPGIHNPNRTSHHLENLYTGCYSVQRQSIGHPIALANTRSSPPVFKCYPYRRITIRNGLYDTKVLSRLNRITSAIKNPMDTGVSVKSQLKSQNFSFEWLKQITISI